MENNNNNVFILSHIIKAAKYTSYTPTYSGHKPDMVTESEIVGVYSTKEKAIHAMQLAEMAWDNEHTYWRKHENKFRTEPPTEQEMINRYINHNKDNPKAKPATPRRAFGLWYRDWQITEKPIDADI